MNIYVNKPNIIHYRCWRHFLLLHKFIYILCLILLSYLPAIAKEPVRTIEGIVTKVSDGDTINVQDSLGTKVKIRLYGIDAPETEKSNNKTGRISKPGQPYGDEAWKALDAKVYRVNG